MAPIPYTVKTVSDARFNRLLILPFHLRWKAKERIRQGRSIYGGYALASSSDGNPDAGSWQAKPPPVPVDATEMAFKLLGLEQATATEADVKRRYRDLAFEHHPDRGGDVKKFHAVAEAKDRCLSALKV